MRGPTMTKKTIVMASAASAALLSVGTMATPVTFVNQCSHVINLYDNKRTENLNTGATTSRDLPNGFSGMFRHGTNPQANLLEFSVANGRIWYDISAIPPGPGYCTSHANCKQFTKKSGFNIAVSMEPQTSAITNVCKKIVCEHEECADAYLFPKDDTKTRSCPDSVPLKIVFCPSGNAAPVPAPAPAPTTNAPSAGPSGAFAPAAGYESGVVSSSPVTATPAPSPSQPKQWTPPAATPSPAQQQWSGNSSSFAGATLKSSFSYTGAKAGSGQGTYSMVTNTKGCVKETVTVNSPVGPLSEEVSMVFRGPMDIYNIAVFDGSAGGDWKKVSSYSQSGETDNMVFLNNKNVDYVTGVKSPQGLASKDGLTKASSAQQFSGYLSEATDPSKIGGGPGIATGAEVNIMTGTKCSADGSCKGYYDDNGYHGWNGGKKMFVTKVKMPWGAAPNQPAIWMLNAQVLRANQYGCNCRGMGAVGGCGELDIAEVIETNNARDKVTTHYYFYDGKIAAGGDNFAARPTNAPTTYITIIDSDSGTIKILEIGESDFDFAASAVASSQISAWINAQNKNVIGY